MNIDLAWNSFKILKNEWEHSILRNIINLISKYFLKPDLFPYLYQVILNREVIKDHVLPNKFHTRVKSVLTTQSVILHLRK
jgi:hypothetical protein